ncbi:hypothetical protein RB597_001008 [Gaeumannomyces tritici]
MSEPKADTEATEETAGEPLGTKNRALLAGASVAQDFTPLKGICAHLNAFHAYASDPTRHVEANHYCGHVNDDVRQCIIYDRPTGPGARIIGVEYMIPRRLYETLPPEERRLWHSHAFEVKSGMLVMPQPLVPDAAWELAENREMEEVMQLYGKVYHLWQVDRGDRLPLGEPQLMTSFTAPGQLDFDTVVADRDARFKTDYKRKQEVRKNLPEPDIHPDADQAWK